MAKSLSSADLVELTKQMVNDSEGMMFSADDVVDSINYSILEYAKNTEACSQYTPVSISVSDGEVFVPIDTLRIKHVTVLNTVTWGEGFMAITKRTLLKSSIDHEVARNEEWENETGTKLRRWVQLDGRTLRLVPLLTGTGGDNGCTIRIDYIQAPKPLTTIEPVAAGSFEIGKWYEIDSAGNTDFDSIGLDVSIEEGSYNQFQATDVGSGTGTAYEIVDPRIYPEHQAYLKYAAAAFLLSMQGTPAAMAKADDMMKKFRALIGVE